MESKFKKVLKVLGLKHDPDYWNPSAIDSYNKTFNFIVSGRGSGKTVSMKKKVFKNWRTKGERFMWVVRNDQELDSNFYNTFFVLFEDIAEDYGFKGSTLYWRPNTDEEEIVGLFASMTNINVRIRKIHIREVSTIIFDEFIVNPMTPRAGYKKNEVDDFFNAYETIARNRAYATKVYWLGNPISFDNPYFRALAIDPRIVRKHRNKIYIPNEDVAVEYFDVPQAVLDKKEDTPYGRVSKLIGGNFYDSVFKSEEQYREDVRLSKTVPDGFRLRAQIKVQGNTLYFFTNGSDVYATDEKSTIERDPYYFTFDLDEWDGNRTTLIDNANPIKILITLIVRSIRMNRYIVKSENVHFDVKELVGVLR